MYSLYTALCASLTHGCVLVLTHRTCASLTHGCVLVLTHRACLCVCAGFVQLLLICDRARAKWGLVGVFSDFVSILGHLPPKNEKSLSNLLTPSIICSTYTSEPLS